MDYVTALRKVQAISQVEHAAIVTIDGEMLASSWQEFSEDAAENAASHWAELVQMALELASLTQRGNVESVGIGMHESAMRFIHIENKTILIVLLDRDHNVFLLYQDLFGYGLGGGPIFPWQPRNALYMQDQAVTDRNQIETYVTALKKLQATNTDIDSAALLGADGKLLAWSWLVSDENAEKAASHCAEFARTALEISRLTSRGDMDFVTVRMQARYVFLAPVGKKYFLAILTRKDAKLGLLLRDIKGGALGIQ